MPELPDLLYIRAKLEPALAGRTITTSEVRQPVVLRMAVEGPLDRAVSGRSVERIDLHGPFLRLELSGGIDLVMHLMLAGRIQHQKPGERAEPYCCVAFDLDDGSRLAVCDDQKGAKVYVVAHGEYAAIPRYSTQGVAVLAPDFTPGRFSELAAQHRRKQVRVFLNDQTILSAIGNAYADEILFEARIHPKTFVARLSADDLARLHTAIGTVLAWGAREVEAAASPVHVKVRTHMRVRNRHGEPCPRCGTTIRREGVHGYDVFYCPACQPASREHFLDWRKTPPAAEGPAR
jgi:formamidopyrimidine-DNA glycosylase